MNSKHLLFIALVGWSACTSTDPDWRPLLQSADLEDFEILNGAATYTRDGDIITGTTTANTPNTFLATKERYGDFELKFEVMMDAGLNSGVQIRSISDTSILDGRVHGYQVEIEDSERGWAAGIYDEARRGWLYPVDFNPSALRTFQKGGWNRYHIICHGDTIRTWLNGQPIANLIDDKTASGLIGFQVHSIYNDADADKKIQWKDIQIKTENVGINPPVGVAPLAEMIPAVDTSTDEFIIQDGHQIKAVAGSPQLFSPVAAEIDPKGNIWAVELPGYMRDIDGSDEDRPDGKIVILSDRDGDGVVDQRTVHKDGLVAPRALCLAYEGLLYNDGRALYFEDLTTGETTLVDSTYVIGGNIEHQPNGLYYNLDNWIYSAKSNVRYRRMNMRWLKEATTIRGQWGMDADVHGRLVYNNNSNGLRGDKVMPNTVIDNEYLEIKALLKNQLSDDQRVYPYQATAMNRGYIPGVLDDEGKLTKFSSACAPIVYKGKGAWERAAFACAPEVNAVKQYDLINADNSFGQDYRQTYANKEFLVSKKETFRPVNLVNHPKGGFLVIDMRKGIIQHRAYMTNYLRELIREKGMDKINNLGQIYHVMPRGMEDQDLSFWNWRSPLADIIPLLDNENGAMRLAAQKELVAKADREIANKIRVAMTKFSTWGKIHALWVLEAHGTLTDIDLQTIYKSWDPVLAYHIIKILESNPNIEFSEIIFDGLKQSDENVHLQLAHCIPFINEPLFTSFEDKYRNRRDFAEAFISNLRFNPYSSERTSVLAKLWESTMDNQADNKKLAPSLITTQFSDNRNEGFPLYNKYCLSCHGHDGYGQDGLAPPILHSEYLDGPSDKLAALILQGLHGPVTVDGEKYDMNLVMPGLKHNPDLGDEEISAIISFVNNAFSKDGKFIPASQVAKVRAQLGGRLEPLTEEEVMKWETKE